MRYIKPEIKSYTSSELFDFPCSCQYVSIGGGRQAKLSPDVAEYRMAQVSTEDMLETLTIRIKGQRVV